MAANLAPSELYKYDHRVQTFVEKYKTGQPFALTKGRGEIVLRHDDSVEYRISNKVDPNTIRLFGLDDRMYRLGDFAKTSEFGGGKGAGAGSELTAIMECATALFIASWMYDTSVGNAYEHCDLSVSFETMRTTQLSPEWKRSCIETAALLEERFPRAKEKDYRVLHQSAWVGSLESCFKRLNKKEAVFSNLNKWNPADIYIVSDVGASVNFDSVESIAELNKLLISMLESEDILPISLKLVGKEATLSFHNSKEEKEVKETRLVRVTTGDNGFFTRKDVCIFFGDGVYDKIQFRSFPVFQGEIKGKSANHGKISTGPINSILSRLEYNQLPNLKELRSDISIKKESLFREFYSLYFTTATDVDRIHFDEFKQQAIAKGNDWIFSKFLACKLLFTISETRKGAEQFVAECIGYASSCSELSGPFVKVS